MKRLTAAVAATVIAASVALPAFAEGTSVSAGMNVKADKTVDVACVQAAVDAREQSIMSAWVSYNTSMTAAFSTRALALHAAWGMTDASARKTAIKAAWSAFAASRKSAMQAHKTAKQAAWKTFRTAAKSCKGGAAQASVEASGEAMDNQ